MLRFFMLFSVVFLFVTQSFAYQVTDDPTPFGYRNTPFGTKPQSLTTTLFVGGLFNGLNQDLPQGVNQFNDIWRYGLALGYQFNEQFGVESHIGFTPTRDNNNEIYHYDMALMGSYDLELVDRFYLYGMLGPGFVYITNPNINSFSRFAVQYSAGLKIYLFKNLNLRADLRGITSFDNVNTAFAPTLGLQYYFQSARSRFDYDGDGIKNEFDQCPRDPETFNGFKDEDGCPEDPNDLDGDGIVNDQDQCPRDPETFNGIKDEDGCPENENDIDGDGIANDLDQCPKQPETVNGFKDNDGCPEDPNDLDGDGFLNQDDQCPREPENINGYKDDDGCPDDDPNDRDFDGIPNDVDECPDEKETVNGFKDNDGCPDHELDEFSGMVEGIHFNLGESEILIDSYAKLNRGAELFQKYPKLKFVIEGHTDSTGSLQVNMKLAKERAESVRLYLMKRGIEPERITVEAFGPARPIATNDTEEGRARNRRIEFRLLNLEEVKKREP